MEQAIKQAIKGGYEPFKTLHMEYALKSDCYGDEFVVESGSGLPFRRKFSTIQIDPLFWQALGKAEGWKDTEIQLPWKMNLEYMRQWHHFIDSLAQGESPDDFFKNIIKDYDVL